jgi:hypothetical protein
MSRLSWKLNLPPLPDPQATDLKDLAEKIEVESPSQLLLRLNADVNSLTSPRSIEEILTDLTNYNAENISPLEWFLCLYRKDEWDQQHPDQAYPTSESIWNAAKSNKWLRERLFWRLALYHDGKPIQGFPSSIVKTFHSDFIPDEAHRELVQLTLSEAHQDQAYKMASYCFSTSQLPKELLEIVRLPTYLQIAQESLTQIPQTFSSLGVISSDAVSLLICCLENLDDDRQVEGVNHILVSVDKEIGGNQPKLVDWLRRNYGISKPNSKWIKLSHAAKINLRKWIGATNYSDFQKLVDRVIERLDLDPKEEHQLKSRRIFWGHYSDRFEKIRILLPQSTARALGQDFGTSDVSIFTQKTYELETEVCIFDFGECFIIEFFRGGSSETRYIKKDPSGRIEEKLFESDIPSPNCLRCLGGSTHDHCYCWQVSCENMLRIQGVKPNDGITEFRRLDKFDRERTDKYHPGTGLSYPPNGIETRKPQASKAHEKTIRIEQKARQNCCGHWSHY